MPLRGDGNEEVDRRRGSDAGSLIVDVLIGMAIIALVALIAVSVFKQYREKVASVAMKSDLTAAAASLTGQTVILKGHYGTDLSALVLSPNVRLVIGSDSDEDDGLDAYVMAVLVDSTSWFGSTDCKGFTTGASNKFVYITGYSPGRYQSLIRPCIAEKSQNALDSADQAIAFLEASQPYGRVFILKANNASTGDDGNQSHIPIPASSPGYISGANGAGNQPNIQRIFDKRNQEIVIYPCIEATHAIFGNLEYHYSMRGEGLGDGPCP